jgi:hypothetical protein
MAEFDFALHRIRGNNNDATAWVRASSLLDEDKADLLTFIGRFSSLTFFHETDKLLDHIEATDRVKLPAWFREMCKVLAFVDPPMHVRFDDYDHLLPRSDDVDGAWYALALGYSDDEQRELFLDKAGCYPIGAWSGTGYSYLAVSLWDDNDRRILEFAREDLLDNVLDGKPARASVRPAFNSYPRMLLHIAQGRSPSGAFIDPT